VVFFVQLLAKHVFCDFSEVMNPPSSWKRMNLGSVRDDYGEYTAEPLSIGKSGIYMPKSI